MDQVTQQIIQQAIHALTIDCDWNTRQQAADQLATLLPKKYTINEGFFAGCEIVLDPFLPPDTVEMHGANVVRLNLRTGEITQKGK